MPRDVAGDAQHALGQGLTWAPRLEKGDLLWRIYGFLWISIDLDGSSMEFLHEFIWISMDNLIDLYGFLMIIYGFQWISMDFRWIDMDNLWRSYDITNGKCGDIGLGAFN